MTLRASSPPAEAAITTTSYGILAEMVSGSSAELMERFRLPSIRSLPDERDERIDIDGLDEVMVEARLAALLRVPFRRHIPRCR